MIPDRADVIIIGGGIIGCSIAYHLAKIGIRDTVLLERRQLCCGTTWHSVGSIAELRGSRRMTELARYTAQLYRDLEAETGLATGYKITGSIMLAQDRQWVLEMNRIAGLAKAFGQEAEIISAADIRDRCPQVKTDDVLAGLYLPTDGRTNPIDTTHALAKGARMRGAKIIENVSVTEVLTENGKACGVLTKQGPIKAEIVVLAAGMWGREFGARHGVSLPLQAAEHFYAVTENIEGLQPNMPFVRVPSESTYYKEDAGKLLFGCLERKAKPWALEGIPPDFCFDSLPEDLDHFEPILESAVERFPLLQQAGIQLFFNGPESFTPDGNALVGETPEIKNLYVACGMNTVGVMIGGAIGKMTSEWIRDRQRPEGFAEFDVARFSPFQSGRNYLRDRTVETLGVLYDHGWPNREYMSARGARRVQLHDMHMSHGAIMGGQSGWEIPLVYAPDGEKRVIEYSFDRQNWTGWAVQECQAARAGVGLCDGSAHAIIEVTGKGARLLADYLSCGKTGKGLMDTVWSTPAGTVHAMVREVAISDERVLFLSHPGTERLLMQWINKNAAAFPDLSVADRTSSFGMFMLAGQGVPDLMRRFGLVDLAGMSLQLCEIGYAQCWVMSAKGIGMKSVILLFPSEVSSHVFEALRDENNGTVPLIGAYASNSLRVAAGLLSWSHDIDDTVPLAKSGLRHWIDQTKADFVGKSALAQQVAVGEAGTFVALTAPDSKTAIWGKELIHRNGAQVGLTTSGAIADQSLHALGLGYVSGPCDSSWFTNGEFTLGTPQGEVSIRCVPLLPGP